MTLFPPRYGQPAGLFSITRSIDDNSSPAQPTPPGLLNHISTTTTMACDNFETADADIILRSVEGQEFRVHKTVLSLASSVFWNMFSFPQPPSAEPTSVPVVDVSETTKVLGLFLRCIYPVSKPIVKDLELLEALIGAADKYEAEIVLDIVGSWLAAPVNLKKDPLRIYAIACSSPALWELEKAAVDCMTFYTILSADPSTIARLSVTKHHNLVVYLVQREKSAKSNIAEDSSWTMFRTLQCICKPETGIEIKEEIKKAVADAFVSGTWLSEEGAVLLAHKQLSTVRACSLGQNCSFVIQGGEYAKELRSRLMEISDDLWCRL